MAQPKLEFISLSVAKKCGDQVSTAAGIGGIFTSQQRINAINEARVSIYLQLLNSLGVDKFANTYMEFIQTTDPEDPIVLLGEDDYIGDTPDYLRQITTVALRDESDDKWYEAKRLPLQAYAEALLNPYSPYAPDQNNVKFSEFSGKFRIYGLPNDTYHAFLTYLSEPIPAELGDLLPDINDPQIWAEQTIEIAYTQLLKDIQRREG